MPLNKISGKYEFTKIGLSNLDLNEFNDLPDKSVLTTKEWIEYISEDSNASPVILRITECKKFLGYFVSLLTVKFGVKIIASPFPGWSTVHMGLDLLENRSKLEIISELIPFLYKSEKCVFVQITDRDITVDMAKQAGYHVSTVDTLELPINFDDNGLFKNMKVDCRNYIRQFERRGASLEVAEPNDEFAEEYYNQLKDVFAKQNLVPTYSLKKVKCLLRNMGESGNILCLRVRNPEGQSIASSIFPGYNKKFFFWGGASYRLSQSYRPNEYMIYSAIQYWRDRGCEIFDMVGIRDYKRKFGSQEKYYASIISAKYDVLIPLQKTAAKLYYLGIKLKGFILKRK